MRRLAWSRWVGLLLTAASLGACDEPRWELVAEGLGEALLSVHGTSARDVWAVGADRGAGPLVLRFEGERWTRLETGSEGDLWWVHAVPGGPVYLGGANATILRYGEGAFTRMRTPGVAAHTIYGIWARAADDAYAVGSVAGGRDGFVWHFDGTAWRELPLPADTPRDGRETVPGLFKVWGDGDDVWIVGGRGVVLRRRGAGPLEVVRTPTTMTLFTVHAAEGRVTAVGGAGGGVVMELGAESAAADVTPEACPLLQGVFLTPGGGGWASGFGAAMYRRQDGRWDEVEHPLRPRIESLHAVWVDPEGGVWAAGGNVVSSRLDAGALLHYGPSVPRVEVRPPSDAGVPDAGPPPVRCPEAQIDPEPTGSIARRWNEANLNAIRRAVPRPGVHARNLFHTSVAMYDAWTAYDTVADGYLVRERHAAADVDAARTEAISYAAYRVLTHRYRTEAGGPVSLACFDAFMERLGFDPSDTSTSGDSPRALGNRIGRAVIETFAGDGANEGDDYADITGYAYVNPPLVVDQPGAPLNDPERWQALNLAVAVTQNGIVTDAGRQDYIGTNWGGVRPFALTRSAPDALYFDVGPGPLLNDAMLLDVMEVIRLSAILDPRDATTIDLSPGAFGNNPLGTNAGTGHGVNPVSGEPYPPNVVPLNDFGRVIAEYWADGPRSETPPGHWNSIANKVGDAPGFEHRLWGEGAAVERLEWDVKMYLAVNGSVHDAAIAAWEIKRVFNTARPISLVRYMGGLGQRTDPGRPSYHPGGLALEPGLVELVTEESSAPGERHAHLAPYLGQVVVRSWRGEPGDRQREYGGVAWIRAVDWIPYQRRTFVSPAFPGYVSGHSTFSRAAAETLTAFTGSPYFPGGLGEFVARANAYLVFEQGPSVEVRLQWASYADAADQAGQSRLWGGIHIAPDDFVGRRMGFEVGQRAAALARRYAEGTAVE